MLEKKNPFFWESAVSCCILLLRSKQSKLHEVSFTIYIDLIIKEISLLYQVPNILKLTMFQKRSQSGSKALRELLYLN